MLSKHLRAAGNVALLGLGLSVAGLIKADEVTTRANAANANAGEFGTNVAASAVLTVSVTLYSEPVANLGASFGNGTHAILLPGGWSLITTSAPPGGCTLLPTQFTNLGGGFYNIRVVPSTYPPSCVWKSGDYVYAFIINVAQPNAYFQHTGGALGKLRIP